MHIFKLISQIEHFKKCMSFFLILSFISNVQIAKANDKQYLIRSRQENNKLNEFYSYSPIKYSQYDNLNSQLKMFFGFDSENPETSFYTDLLIIDYSKNIRDMYKLKLNDMTIKK